MANLDRDLRQLRLRFLTLGGNAVNTAVTLAATTKAITFSPSPEINTSYGVVATPNWSTTVFITLKLTTGFTVNFGTGAPANATVDYIVFRSA